MNRKRHLYYLHLESYLHDTVETALDLMTTFVFADDEQKHLKSKRHSRRHRGNSILTSQSIAGTSHDASSPSTGVTPTRRFSSQNKRPNSRVIPESSNMLSEQQIILKQSVPVIKPCPNHKLSPVINKLKDDEMNDADEVGELVLRQTRPKGTKSIQAIVLNVPFHENNHKSSSLRSSNSNRSYSSNCSEDPSLYGAQILSSSQGATSSLNKNKQLSRTPTRGYSNNDLATDSFSFAEDSLAYSADEDRVDSSPHYVTNSNVLKLKRELRNFTPLHEIQDEDEEASAKSEESSLNLGDAGGFDKASAVETSSSSSPRLKKKDKKISPISRPRSNGSFVMHEIDGFPRTVSLSSSSEDARKWSHLSRHRKSAAAAPTKSTRGSKKTDGSKDKIDSECPDLFNSQWWMCGLADALLLRTNTTT